MHQHGTRRGNRRIACGARCGFNVGGIQDKAPAAIAAVTIAAAVAAAAEVAAGGAAERQEGQARLLALAARIGSTTTSTSSTTTSTTSTWHHSTTTNARRPVHAHQRLSHRLPGLSARPDQHHQVRHRELGSHPRAERHRGSDARRLLQAHAPCACCGEGQVVQAAGGLELGEELGSDCAWWLGAAPPTACRARR
jgi:hypothetical protein